VKYLATRLRFVLCLVLVRLACTSAYAQLTPSADAYTNTASATTNFGAKALLDVESASQTAYIQFDLSAIPTGYTGANIAKASLKLYVNTVTKPASFNVDFVNGTWSENTITANLAPALGPTIAASVPLTTADKNQYIVIDITAAVQAWLNGSQPNDGIALVGNSPLNATFDSKESTTTSHSAELDIVFAGSSGTGITGITTPNGSGLIGGGTSGTLNLSLTHDCANNQMLQWNGAGWACASAGTGTITAVTAGTDLTGGGTGGTVTLNLNTSATDGRYAQLKANNSFTGIQTINGTESMQGSSSTQTLIVNQNGLASTGDAIHGLTSATGGTGVYGNGAIGIQGVANPSTGLSGLFRGTVKITGDGNNLLAGDPGCGSGYAGLGAPSSGSLSGCSNYALIGGPKGDTYVNSNGTAAIHFRSNNNELVTIDNSGNVNVIGQNNGGNLTVTGTLTVGGKQSGDGVSGKSTTVGVYGSSAGASQQGAGSQHAGLWGDTGGKSGDGYYGVFGTADANSAGGFFNNGAFATLVAKNSAPRGSGVIAIKGESANVGVYGLSAGASQEGNKFGQAGVWGDSGGGSLDGYVGVLGTADMNSAGGFFNNSGGEGAVGPTLYLENDTSASEGFLLAAEGGPPSGSGGVCYIDTQGNLNCFGGSEEITISVDSGTRKVALYSMQSPENWFEDAGTGQLTNGSTRIDLEPVFAQTVNAGVPYHVFLTPDGDCKGLYVSQKSATSFEVHELGGGTSSIAFDYRIMAKRVGYESVRLNDLTEQFRKLGSLRATMRRPVQPSLSSRSASITPERPQLTAKKK
jgi:hypothetical protein